jgi:hypothetical protein
VKEWACTLVGHHDNEGKAMEMEQQGWRLHTNTLLLIRFLNSLIYRFYNKALYQYMFLLDFLARYHYFLVVKLGYLLNNFL